MKRLFSTVRSEVTRRAHAWALTMAARLGSDPAIAVQDLKRENAELRLEGARLVDLAFSDHLTDLPNERSWVARVQHEHLSTQRSKDKKLIATLDVDDFKRTNDTFGHQTGDNALIYIARTLKETLRDTDFVARIHGDEYWLIATLKASETLTYEEAALLVMDKVRSAVEKGQFKIDDERPQSVKLPFDHAKVTVSIGGVIDEGDGTALGTLKARADAALYISKNPSPGLKHGNRVSLCKVELDKQGQGLESYISHPAAMAPQQAVLPELPVYTTGPIVQNFVSPFPLKPSPAFLSLAA